MVDVVDVWPEGLFDEPDPLRAELVLRARRVSARPLPARPPQPAPTVKPPRRRDRAALLPAAELVSVQELTDALGLSRTTLHRLRGTPKFPKPLQLSERRVAFRTSEIRAWLATRERARSPCVRDQRELGADTYQEMALAA